MKAFWTVVVIIIIIVGIVFIVQNSSDTPTEENGAMMIEGEKELVNGTYTVDTQESTLTWTGSKTLIANYEDSGTIDLASGSIKIDNNALTLAEFVIDMSTITTSSVSNDMPIINLTQHLKSDAFFDVENFPEAQFVVTRAVESQEEGATHEITGDLTIKGISNSISFPATILQSGDSIVAHGVVTFDRTDFDVRFGSDSFFDNLGDNVINDAITLELDLHATPVAR